MWLFLMSRDAVLVLRCHSAYFILRVIIIHEVLPNHTNERVFCTPPVGPSLTLHCFPPARRAHDLYLPKVDP